MTQRAVLTPTEPFDADTLVHFADALSERGYDSFWLPELSWVSASCGGSNNSKTRARG